MEPAIFLRSIATSASKIPPPRFMNLVFRGSKRALGTVRTALVIYVLVLSPAFSAADTLIELYRGQGHSEDKKTRVDDLEISASARRGSPRKGFPKGKDRVPATMSHIHHLISW